MTLRELIFEVSLLGFDEEGGGGDILIAAANRAARTVFLELGVTAALTLSAEEGEAVGENLLCFDVRALRGDFLAFHTPPRDAAGLPVRGARLCDGRLYLPADFSGRATLIYKRLPRRICIEDKDRQMDIPEEYCLLMPLLCAYYVSLDGEPELAAEYFERYRELLAKIKACTAEGGVQGYIDTNGWA